MQRRSKTQQILTDSNGYIPCYVAIVYTMTDTLKGTIGGIVMAVCKSGNSSRNVVVVDATAAGGDAGDGGSGGGVDNILKFNILVKYTISTNPIWPIEKKREKGRKTESEFGKLVLVEHKRMG